MHYVYEQHCTGSYCRSRDRRLRSYETREVKCFFPEWTVRSYRGRVCTVGPSLPTKKKKKRIKSKRFIHAHLFVLYTFKSVHTMFRHWTSSPAVGRGDSKEMQTRMITTGRIVTSTESEHGNARVPVHYGTHTHTQCRRMIVNCDTQPPNGGPWIAEFKLTKIIINLLCNPIRSRKTVQRERYGDNGQEAAGSRNAVRCILLVHRRLQWFASSDERRRTYIHRVTFRILASLSKCRKAQNPPTERKHFLRRQTKIQWKRHSRRDIKSFVFFSTVFDNDVNGDRWKGLRANST